MVKKVIPFHPCVVKAAKDADERFSKEIAELVNVSTRYLRGTSDRWETRVALTMWVLNCSEQSLDYILASLRES
jgi:hypothetical protein